MIDGRSAFVNKLYGATGGDSNARLGELKERCRPSLTVIEFHELSFRSFDRGAHALFSEMTALQETDG